MKHMEKLAPIGYGQEWDNIGLLVGDPTQEIHRVLLALDATEEVIDEAVAKKVDLIITHHPLLFKRIKSIRKDTPVGQCIYKLIQHHISCYAAHTNLDIAFGGTNEILAQKLGVYDTKVLHPLCSEGEVFGFGRIGRLKEPVTLEQYGNFVRDHLGLTHIQVVGNLQRNIHKVALCSGSGIEFMKDAVASGADVYVTGDIKFHDAQAAQQMDLCLIDASHYGTENIVIPTLAKYLKNWAELESHRVDILASEINGQPFYLLK